MKLFHWADHWLQKMVSPVFSLNWKKTKGEIFIKRYFTSCQLFCIGLLKIVLTSNLLALKIWGLLFLWVAHLNNKNNVYNQEKSQWKLHLLIFMLWVLVASSWNLHHFQSFSSLQSGNGSISVPDPERRGGGGTVSPKFFLPLPASVWSKNKEGPGPLSGFAPEFCLSGG